MPTGDGLLLADLEEDNMPTIEQICDSILDGKAISGIDVKLHEKAAQEKNNQTQDEIPEYERIARILDDISSSSDKEDVEEVVEEKTKVAEDVTPPANGRMEKMAVAATILDTLSELSEDGSAEKCFKEYFQERV